MCTELIPLWLCHGYVVGRHHLVLTVRRAVIRLSVQNNQLQRALVKPFIRSIERGQQNQNLFQGGTDAPNRFFMNGMSFISLLPFLLFSVLSDFEKGQGRRWQYLCVCLCVCPLQAISRKLLKSSSSNLARWLPLQAWRCITRYLYWPRPSFKVTQIVIVKVITVRLFQIFFKQWP